MVKFICSILSGLSLLKDSPSHQVNGEPCDKDVFSKSFYEMLLDDALGAQPIQFSVENKSTATSTAPFMAQVSLIQRALIFDKHLFYQFHHL